MTALSSPATSDPRRSPVSLASEPARKTAAITQKEPSRYGYKAHVKIMPEQIAVLEAHGLHTVAHGEDKYEISSRYQGVDIAELLPLHLGSVKRDGRTALLNLDQLSRLSSFLNQPVHITMRAATAPAESRKAKREREAAIQEDRRNLHKVLRLMTTGSVTIPEHKNEELDAAESLECHAKTQTGWEAELIWNSASEFSTTATQDACTREDHKRLPPPTIPGIAYVPGRGFRLPLHAAMRTELFKGDAQEAVATKIWSKIHQVTNNRYSAAQACAAPDAAVYLSAAELQRFLRRMSEELKTETGANSAFAENIKTAEIEERTQNALANIRRDAASIRQGQAFRAAAGVEEMTQAKLKALTLATTALTPVLNSRAMHEAWALYNHTARDAPVIAEIITDLQVMNAAVAALTNNGETVADPAEVEALAQRFYPTLAFCRHVCATLETYLEKGLKKSGDPEAQSAIISSLQSMDTAFANAGLARAALDEDKLPENYRDLLKTIKKSTAQGGNVMVNTGHEGIETTKEFAGDILTTYVEYPLIGLMTTAVMVMMFQQSLATQQEYLSKNEQMTARTVQAVSIDENGNFISDDVNPDHIQAPEHTKFYSVHFHPFIGGLINVKHVLTDAFVITPTENQLSWIDQGMKWTTQITGPGLEGVESGFYEAAKSGVDPAAEIWFDGNVAQNASHTNLAVWSSMTGFMFGLTGVRRIGEFFDGVRDIEYALRQTRPLLLPGVVTGIMASAAYNGDLSYGTVVAGALAGGALGYALRHRRNGGVSETLADAMLQEKYADCTLAESLAELNARAKIVHTQALNSSNPAVVNFRFGRFKNDLRLDSATAQDLGAALNALEVMTAHMQETLGLTGKDRWYQLFLAEQLHKSRQALEAYQAGTLSAAQLTRELRAPLQNLMEAEFYLTGESQVFRAAFARSADEKLSAILSRHGKTLYNRGKRQERLSRHWLMLTGQDAEHTDMYITGLGSVKKKLPCGHTETQKGEGILKSAVVVCATQVARPLARLNGVVRGVSDLMSGRTKALAAAAVIGGIGTAVALDYNGHRNDISSAAGAVTGVAVTSANFLAYNIVEDVTLLHGAVIFSGILGGTIAGAGYRRGLRPLKLAIAETPHAKKLKVLMAAGEGVGLGFALQYLAKQFGAEVEIEHAIAATAALSVAGQMAPEKAKALYDGCVKAWKVVSKKCAGAIQIGCCEIDHVWNGPRSLVANQTHAPTL